MSKNREQQLIKERFRELFSYGNTVVNESSSIKNATLIEYRKAGDGKLYGIVKENQDYFIKAATKFEYKEPGVEDFVYLGGLQNKNQFKYSTLGETQKTLNAKISTINETFGYFEEDDQQKPMPEPAPSPEGGETPMPEPAPSPEGGEEIDPINKAKSFIGKAGNYIKTSPDISSEMSKQLINMFVGYFDLFKLTPEDKQQIVDKLYNKELDEDVDIQKMDDDIDMTLESVLREEVTPSLQDISIILAGVSGLFGGSFAIAKLMDLLKKKKPDLVNKIERLGKSAGNSIMGGTEKFNESKQISSEKLIKFYANKYNVSEQVILNTVGKYLKEEKIKKDKLIKENKLRMVVREIIKEKLGLKKKMIKEGKQSPLRTKLEKAVDIVLKEKETNKKK